MTSKSSNRLLIAVDPSLSCTGFALFVNGSLKGTYKINTKSSQTRQERIMIISHLFSSLLKVEGGYDVVELVFEKPFIHGRNIRGSMAVVEVKGMLTGIFLNHYQHYEEGTLLKLDEMSIQEINRTMGIKKRLKSAERKKHIAKEIKKILPKWKGTQDEMDAVCVGLAYHRKCVFDNVLKDLTGKGENKVDKVNKV